MAQIIKWDKNLLDKANTEVKMLSISEAGAVFDKDYVFVIYATYVKFSVAEKFRRLFLSRGMLEFWIDPQSLSQGYLQSG